MFSPPAYTGSLRVPTAQVDSPLKPVSTIPVCSMFDSSNSISFSVLRNKTFVELPLSIRILFTSQLAIGRMITSASSCGLHTARISSLLNAIQYPSLRSPGEHLGTTVFARRACSLHVELVSPLKTDHPLIIPINI